MEIGQGEPKNPLCQNCDKFYGKVWDVTGYLGKNRETPMRAFIKSFQTDANHFAYLEWVLFSLVKTSGSHEVRGSIPLSSTE